MGGAVISLRSEGISDVMARMAALGDKASPAIVRALNRGGLTAKTYMASNVAKDMKLKVSDVKEKIRVKEANLYKHSFEISASLKRLPLILFNARGPEPSRGRGRGVTARTNTKRYPHAFIATMKSGHRGVFQRVGKARLGIRELRNVSLGHVFDKFKPEGLKRGLASVAKNLKSEFRFASRKS